MSDAKRLEKLYGRVRQSTWDSANGWYVGEVDLDEFKALAVRLLEERDEARVERGIYSRDKIAHMAEIERLREGIEAALANASGGEMGLVNRLSALLEGGP